jgi:hypothetical protein
MSALIGGCTAGAERVEQLSPPEVAQRVQAIGVVPRGSTCGQLGLGAQAFTLVSPVDGDYAIDAQNSLKFRYYDETHTDFFFTQSTIRMTGVLASNGDRTMMWEMPDGADGWPSLTGPPDPETGAVQTPEEVTFCYDYELYVQPSPLATFVRRATWALTKSGRATPLSLEEGQTAALDYTVTARTTGSAPVGQFFHGAVFVQNKSPDEVTVSAVTTAVGELAATIACPQAPPFTMAPFTVVECELLAEVPDAADRLIVGGGAVSHGLKVTTREVTGSFSAHNVTTLMMDRCVTVSDTAAPASDHQLGSVCVEQGEATFAFSSQVGPFACGDFAVTSTAGYVAEDTGTTGTAGWTVTGTVVCDPGCTQEVGYWRDHPNDPMWSLVGPAGRNTGFFRSGTTYYGALFVLPLLNPYWPLATEYIAARLNQLTGVELPAATQAAFQEATGILQAQTPLQVQLNLLLHARIISLTRTMRDFNEGETGPGACH